MIKARARRARARMPSNCVVWCLWQWATRGGYVRVRRTDVEVLPGWKGWWPHMDWSPDGYWWWSYVPAEWARRRKRGIVFHGRPKLVQGREVTAASQAERVR